MRSILVGVRGDLDREPALDVALEEAVRRRLPLDAVHCYQLASYGEWPPALVLRGDDRREEAVRTLASAVERAVVRVPGGVTADVRQRVLEGAPADCLLGLGATTAMLVVGTRGGGALRRAARGSVSAQVLHRSWAPVVLVPHATPVVPDRWLRSRVVAALDGSPASLSALTWAVAQAVEWGSQLAPVVVSSPTGRPPAALAGPLEVAVARAVAEAGGHSLEVHPHFLEGAPVRSLLSFVRPQDLLVMGSRGRGGTASLFLGSTSTAVGERASCPVVVVREGQARRETHQRARDRGRLQAG